MLKVYKYPVPLLDIAVIDIPKDARLLRVDVQDANPFLWAMVDTTSPMVRRRLRVAGTGHDLGDGVTPYTYVGSVLLQGGLLVFHVFDLGEVK